MAGLLRALPPQPPLLGLGLILEGVEEGCVGVVGRDDEDTGVAVLEQQQLDHLAVVQVDVGQGAVVGVEALAVKFERDLGSEGQQGPGVVGGLGAVALYISVGVDGGRNRCGSGCGCGCGDGSGVDEAGAFQLCCGQRTPGAGGASSELNLLEASLCGGLLALSDALRRTERP